MPSTIPSSVALLRLASYDRPLLREAVASLCAHLPFACSPGSRVLLKPNLVTARGHNGLACTHPELVAVVAEWFLDHGAAVAIGDSPAFGTARGVMAACGIRAAVAGLPVKLVDFDRWEPVRLASGPVVQLAREALECDLLINLPKLKAHGQMLVSLAVKNHFGAVAGWRKPYLHMRWGGGAGERFAALIVDLLQVLPAGLSLVDGITAMHRAGPVLGEPFPLGLLAGAVNPVAADTALLLALGIEPAASPIWRECARRGLPGSLAQELAFPLLAPAEAAAAGFEVPPHLAPVRFHAGQVLRSSFRRLRMKNDSN
jgi:uncharacterized protein (DUF362 family)